MPAFPNPLLRVTARLLESRMGARMSRGTLAAAHPVPVVGVDWLAERQPRGTPRRDATPLVIPLDHPPGPLTGPLGGEGVVVKDSLDVQGVPSRVGLREHAASEHEVEIALEDAAIVARIRDAGGWIQGKTKMTELGMDGLGALMAQPMPHNPISPGYFPGGSSTGSAVAVASGLARYGVGGDGLGSVRIPAAFTGLVGLKPGHETLSHVGYRSVAPSMDVPGPMTRDAADCARLFQILAGLPVESLAPALPSRVALVRGLGPELSSRDVAAAFERVLRTLSIETRDVEVEGASGSALLAVAVATAELGQSALARERMSMAGRLNVAMGRALGFAERDALERERRRLREATERAIDSVGFLAMPTTAIPAPALRPRLLAGAQDPMLMRAIGAYTPLANLTGLPAIALPVGRDARGRALSFMLVGPRGSELSLLGAALAIEKAGLARRPIGPKATSR